MFKSVYEFTKVFSVLFFLSGVFFLFKEMYFLAFITMFSFFAIKFIDSDWAFDNFKFSNHNLVVVFITFGLIFVNFFAIYQELRFSPVLTRVTQEDKESYLIYENALYSSIEPCIKTHNALVNRLNNNVPVYKSDIKNANGNCYRVIDNIDKQVIPTNFSPEIKILCLRMKDEFKKMAVNLATYNYSPQAPQEGLIMRVKSNLEASTSSMIKIREIMHMTEELDESKRTFVKL